MCLLAFSRDTWNNLIFILQTKAASATILALSLTLVLPNSLHSGEMNSLKRFDKSQSQSSEKEKTQCKNLDDAGHVFTESLQSPEGPVHEGARSHTEQCVLHPTSNGKPRQGHLAHTTVGRQTPPLPPPAGMRSAQGDYSPIPWELMSRI